jgi:hypothetical protein
MPSRRRLARERLEYYLLYLILAYRYLILLGGLALLVFAAAFLFVNPYAGFVILVPALFLLLVSSSYNAVLYTARLGAWIGTLGRFDD